MIILIFCSSCKLGLLGSFSIRSFASLPLIIDLCTLTIHQTPWQTHFCLGRCNESIKGLGFSSLSWMVIVLMLISREWWPFRSLPQVVAYVRTILVHVGSWNDRLSNGHTDQLHCKYIYYILLVFKQNKHGRGGLCLLQNRQLWLASIQRISVRNFLVKRLRP